MWGDKPDTYTHSFNDDIFDKSIMKSKLILCPGLLPADHMAGRTNYGACRVVHGGVLLQAAGEVALLIHLQNRQRAQHRTKINLRRLHRHQSLQWRLIGKRTEDTFGNNNSQRGEKAWWSKTCENSAASQYIVYMEKAFIYKALYTGITSWLSVKIRKMGGFIIQNSTAAHHDAKTALFHWKTEDFQNSSIRNFFGASFVPAFGASNFPQRIFFCHLLKKTFQNSLKLRHHHSNTFFLCFKIKTVTLIVPSHTNFWMLRRKSEARKSK